MLSIIDPEQAVGHDTWLWDCNDYERQMMRGSAGSGLLRYFYVCNAVLRDDKFIKGSRSVRTACAPRPSSLLRTTFASTHLIAITVLDLSPRISPTPICTTADSTSHSRECCYYVRGSCQDQIRAPFTNTHEHQRLDGGQRRPTRCASTCCFNEPSGGDHELRCACRDRRWDDRYADSLRA